MSQLESRVEGQGDLVWLGANARNGCSHPIVYKASTGKNLDNPYPAHSSALKCAVLVATLLTSLIVAGVIGTQSICGFNHFGHFLKECGISLSKLTSAQIGEYIITPFVGSTAIIGLFLLFGPRLIEAAYKNWFVRHEWVVILSKDQSSDSESEMDLNE